MSEAVLQHWHDTVDRLRAAEPLRLLIGDKLYNSSEIVLTASFAASLRSDVIAEIEARIAQLTPTPPDPSAPAGAMPLPEERTA